MNPSYTIQEPSKKPTCKHLTHKEFIEFCALCLFLPPFISTIFSFIKFLNYRNKSTAVLFIIFFTLYLSYNFVSVDNSLRFFSAEKISDYSNWYEGDPLTYLIHLGNQIHISSSSFFYLFTLTIYLFWYYSYRNIRKDLKKWDIIILITAVILRNAIDLSYYTLSLTFLIFYVTKKSHITIWDYIIIIIIIFLLHPGVLMVFLPSILLYYIIQNRSTALYYLYLVSLFILTANLQNIIPITGISIIDNIGNAYSHYTSTDNKWGVREDNLSGMTYFIQYYVIVSLHFIIFIFTIIKRNKIKNKFILSIFQTTIVMLPNFWNYVTITERLMVVLSLTSILCLIMLQQEYKIQTKYIAYICVFIFVFHTFRASRMDLNGVFNKNSYQEIQQRSYYIPSILLFNFDTWGYSNEFMNKNSQFKYFLD